MWVDSRNSPRMIGHLLPIKHVRMTLAAALVSALLVGVWLLIALPPSSDVWFYQHWSRLVTLHGISAAYSGEPVKDYVDYPPFLLYPWRLVGGLYRPSAMRSSMWTR